jgi:hypothetical protein
MEAISRKPLAGIYKEAVQGAKKPTASERHQFLMGHFGGFLSETFSKWPRTLTQEYSVAMETEASGWAESRIGAYIVTGIAISVTLGLALLSQWKVAGRIRNVLSLNCGLLAILTFVVGRKAAHSFTENERLAREAAEEPLFDIYDPIARASLATVAREEGGWTKAIDQFVGQRYVVKRDNQWEIKTLCADDLTNINFNLFKLTLFNSATCDKLCGLRELAVGYVAAKRAYEEDDGDRQEEFSALCEKINGQAKEFIPKSTRHAN